MLKLIKTIFVLIRVCNENLQIQDCCEIYMVFVLQLRNQARNYLFFCIGLNVFVVFKQEVEKLRVIFRRNAFPNWFLDKVINDFETHKNANNNDRNNLQSSESDFLFSFGIP